jgi:hypothetical protein
MKHRRATSKIESLLEEGLDFCQAARNSAKSELENALETRISYS